MSPTIEERLEDLERRLDRLSSEPISVREIRLVDEHGQVRGVISADGAGPVLAFSDDSGHVRAKLEVGSEGPGLTLADENGQTRAWLGFSKESLRIGFADERGKSRAFFGVMPSSGPVAKFYDEEQRLIWSAPEGVVPNGHS